MITIESDAKGISAGRLATMEKNHETLRATLRH